MLRCTLGCYFIEITGEINATERIHHLQFPRGGDMPHHAGSLGSRRFDQEAEGMRGSMGQRLCCIFSGKGRRGMGHCLGLG